MQVAIAIDVACTTLALLHLAIKLIRENCSHELSLAASPQTLGTALNEDVQISIKICETIQGRKYKVMHFPFRTTTENSHANIKNILIANILARV